MRKAFIIGALFVFMLTVLSCAGMQFGADTPKQTYLKARMAYNGLLADYVADKRAAPPEVRKKWTADIDPYFESTSVALKAWGQAVRVDAPAYNQQMAYMELKNQLLDLLLAEMTEYD